MTEGLPEPPLNAEDRVDRDVFAAEFEHRRDQANQPRIGPVPVREFGGGGADGGYAITPEALALSITQWNTKLEEIRDDGARLRDAHRLANPPADDGPSVRQAEEYKTWIEKMINHNLGMQAYAHDQIDKLTAANHAYQDAETTAKNELRQAGGD